MNTGAPEPVEDLADGAEAVEPAEADRATPSRARCLDPAGLPADGVPPRRRVDERAPDARRPAASPPGEGPVAVDAERASGYRYGQRAYLVQLRREGAGTCADRPDRAAPTSPRCGDALADAEWVLHAATQDLPCLAEVGPAPAAALRHRARRPAGSAYPRVGLGRRRRAAASASAWRRSTPPSTGRPGRCPSRGCATPPSTSRCWSSCATPWPPTCAEQGKAGVGRSRSSTPLADFAGPPPRVDPWRRTSGMHRVRSRRAARASSASCGRPATQIARRPRRLPRPGPARRRDRRGRARRSRPARPSCRAAGLHRPRRRALPAAVAGRRRRGARRCRTAELPPHDPARPTARRRRAPGPTATRSPPPGWPPARAALAALADEHVDAGREPALPRRRCAGCCWTPPERRRRRRRRRGAAPRSAPGPGRSSWSRRTIAARVRGRTRDRLSPAATGPADAAGDGSHAARSR